MNRTFNKIIATALVALTLSAVPVQAQSFEEVTTVVRTEKSCAFWSGVASSGYRIKYTDYNSFGGVVGWRWTKTPCGNSAEADVLPIFRNLPPLSEVLKMPLPERGTSLNGCNQNYMVVSIDWKGEQSPGKTFRCTLRSNG